MSNPDFIKRFIWLRTEHLNLSQKEMGARMGVGKNTVASYESGDSYPSWKAIYALVEHEPSINLDWLIRGDGDPFHSSQDDNESTVQSIKDTFFQDDEFRKLYEAYCVVKDEKVREKIRKMVEMMSELDRG